MCVENHSRHSASGSARALNRRNQSRYSAAGYGNLFHVDFTACNAWQNGMDAAAKVVCPVTLVVGQHDQMTPASASHQLARALDARIVSLPLVKVSWMYADVLKTL